MSEYGKKDVRHMTLGAVGAWDVYRKLVWDVQTYREAAARKIPFGDTAAVEVRYPMYAAANAAATAWSLVEWLWFEAEQLPNACDKLLTWAHAPQTGKRSKAFQAGASKKVADIKACHQIALAMKHAQLHDIADGFSTPTVFNIWVNDAGEYFLAQDGSVVFEDGCAGDPLDAFFDRVLEWWHNTLTEHGVPERHA